MTPAQRPSAASAAAHRTIAVALLAFAGLTAELAWTRVAGLLFYGDVAWLIVTLAVAGLALGAAAGAAVPGWLRTAGAARAATLAGLLVTAGLATVLAADGRGGLLLAGGAALPGFAAMGVALAGIFAGDARRAPRLYAADLAGAATAAAISLPLVATVGAPDALLFAAAAAAAAGAVLAPVRPLRGLAGAAALLLAVSVVLPGPDADPGRAATRKSITVELERGAERLATRWGTVGRSDLVRRADGAEILYLDGAAGSLLPTPDSGPLWRGDLGRFAFEVLRPEQVFVVGGGAGLEVAHALETGAERVDVAELNAAGANLARSRLASLRAPATDDPAQAPDPFGDPRVTWYPDEARATLRALDRRYDLITLSQAVTRSAEARGLALSENGLYTVEATGELLAGLRPDGVVAYELYDEATLTRSLITAAVALQERNVAASDAGALAHLLAVLDPRTSPPTPLLLLFREAPSRPRVIELARAAEARGYGLLLLPGLLAPPSLQPVAEGRERFADVVAAAPDVDLAPVRDDAPFYWAFAPGVPPALRRAVIAVGLGALALTVLLIATLPQAPASRGRRPGLLAALLLGTAFLALEVAVLSRTGLLLGHPSAALAVTLTGLLAGAGAGAAWARRRPDRWRSLATAALVAAIAGAAWTWIWPLAADAWTGWPAWLRGAATMATLVPLGAALGVPFPLLLRRIGAAGDPSGDPVQRSGRLPSSDVARAWALNGAGSLLGGVGAVALAHLAGFTVVAFVAVGVYLITAGLAASIRTS